MKQEQVTFYRQKTFINPTKTECIIMKEFYHKYSLIIALCVTLLLGFIMRLFIPLQDVECSKSKNTCFIYSRNIISGETELINEFKLSDIRELKSNYEKDSPHSGSYKIYVYLYNGETIELESGTNKGKRAQEICRNMLNTDNFILKGNFWIP